MTKAIPKGTPTPFDCFKVTATEALWTWWRAGEKIEGSASGKPTDAKQFIEGLLTGPDDVELSPREMALLEAHLKQPGRGSDIQREKQAAGRSRTQDDRNKLKLIWDFNRGLSEVNTELADPASPKELPRVEIPSKTPSNDHPSVVLLRVFTNGLSDDRFKHAAQLLAAGELTANEKLTRIDSLIHFPATASAEQLGDMLGVSKQAVLKSDWWKQNRKGEKASEIGRRRDRHKKRSEESEHRGDSDEEEAR